MIELPSPIGLEGLFSTFAQFADSLKRVDWVDVIETFNRAVAEHIGAARQLAEKGWTVPAWGNLSDPLELCRLSEAELDARFTVEYTKDDFRLVREQVENVANKPDMTIWNPILLEVRDSIISGRHLITVPALLSVLEGYAVAHVLRLPSDQMRRTDICKLFRCAGLHEKAGLEALPAVSNFFFLERLFAPSHFEQAPPQFINRHWALHGRDQCNWIQADAFRLLNALETLCWIKDVQEDRLPSSCYRSFDVE